MKKVLLVLLCMVVALSTILAPALVVNASPTPANSIQAYYDGKLFNIQLVPMPENAQTTLLLKNGQLNNIYMASGFIPVLDAIPTDGMNPLWLQQNITFLTIAPTQFLSDNDVLAALNTIPPEISLTPGVLFKCPVVGQKPK